MEVKDVKFILLIPGILIHFVHTEREFFYVTTKLNWNEAQTYCRQKFTDLVTIYDDHENQKLMTLAENGQLNECIWIGIHHNIDNWKWSTGVSTFFVNKTDAVWAAHEPDNAEGNQYCVVLSATGLADRRCSSANTFFCFDGKATVNYVTVATTLGWSDALTYCRKHHDDLASISSYEEFNKLQLMLTESGTNSAWIGLYRDPWTSWSDNHTTTFYNWAAGQPYSHTTNDYSGCLSNSLGKWNDEPCNTSLPFFCYGDVRKQTILKMKLQSEADMNNKEIQHQILEQMKNKLGSVGETNFTVKWRVTTRASNSVEPGVDNTAK